MRLGRAIGDGEPVLVEGQELDVREIDEPLQPIVDVAERIGRRAAVVAVTSAAGDAVKAELGVRTSGPHDLNRLGVQVSRGLLERIGQGSLRFGDALAPDQFGTPRLDVAVPVVVEIGGEVHGRVQTRTTRAIAPDLGVELDVDAHHARVPRRNPLVKHACNGRGVPRTEAGFLRDAHPVGADVEHEPMLVQADGVALDRQRAEVDHRLPVGAAAAKSLVVVRVHHPVERERPLRDVPVDQEGRRLGRLGHRRQQPEGRARGEHDRPEAPPKAGGEGTRL